MAELVTTVFDDLRAVTPHGLEPPVEDGGCPPGGPGGGTTRIKVPSHEIDTETWADQEMNPPGGGGAGIPQGGIKGVKGPKEEKPEKGLPGEPGEPEEGEEPQEGEGTGDKVTDKLIDKYVNSHSADSDQLRDQMMNPEMDGRTGGDTGTKMPWPDSLSRPTRDDVDAHWKKFEQNRRKYVRDVRTRHKSQDRTFDKTIQPPGIGLGQTFANLGFRPLETGIWKRQLRDWLKSLPKKEYRDLWTRPNIRMQSAFQQMEKITGYRGVLPAKNVPIPKLKAANVLVLVDVSGSVFSKTIQEEFRSILIAADKEEGIGYIDIFTFDDGAQQGPFKPKDYNPKMGGGGTQPWGFIANLLATPKYANNRVDGYCIMTDGAFANPPPGLIKTPKKWAFVMTSTYTSDSIPDDSLIIETYVDDAAYEKEQKVKGAKDIMREAKRKKRS